MRKNSQTPLRIAHRGAPKEHPENTLPSFARALELGADAIELDVHVTCDRVVVVHHDPVPRARATDRSLAGREIADLTFEQLQTFQVSPTATIPRLSDVLALVGNAAFVYVELKGIGVEGPAIDAIRASRTRCAVHSFDHAAVARAGHIAPDIQRGVLFDRRPADAVAVMAESGARDAWPKWSMVDRAFVQSVQEIGGSVIAWTVNDRAVAARLRAIGVDGICTDDLSILD